MSHITGSNLHFNTPAMPKDNMAHLTGSNLHHNTSAAPTMNMNQSMQHQSQHQSHMSNLTPQKSIAPPPPPQAAIDPGLARLFVSPTAEDLQRRRQRQRQQQRGGGGGGLSQRSPNTPVTPSTPQPMGRGGGGGGMMGESPLPNPSFDGAADDQPLAGESIASSPISARCVVVWVGVVGGAWWVVGGGWCGVVVCGAWWCVVECYVGRVCSSVYYYNI